jgi:hypothetical protein
MREARWLFTGTPVGEPYPCRCHEAKYGRCSPVFCPCAGRLDRAVLPPGCCAHDFTPEHVTVARAAYDLKRRREREIL